VEARAQERPPNSSGCSAGLAVQALRLFNVFCLSLFEKRTQKGMERPQGYKSNPALQAPRLFHVLVRHCGFGMTHA